MKKSYETRRVSFELLESRRLMAFDPTAFEQEMLQLINRFRTDPTGEYSRLISTDSPLKSFDPEVTNDLNVSQVDGSMLRSELSRLSAAPPLGWNEVVYNLASTQNGTMIAKNSEEHFPNLAITLNSMGVPIEAGTGQNAFYNSKGIGKSPFYVHSAYIIDWANNAPGAVGGMQKDRPHRVNLINPLYNQVGSAITPTNILVNTQMFAKISSAQKLVMGALFEDKNKSGWYEAGEGIGSAQIEFKNQSSGEIITTRALTAGGYQVVLPAGTYSATATGGNLAHAVVVQNLTVGTSNVWQNLIYDPAAVQPDAMEPNNSITSASDVGGRDQTLNSLSIHSGDIDCFKFTPNSTGAATIDLRFTQANGNIDMRLLDAGGTVIASSITLNTPESITANVTRGQVYFVQVYSNTSATNGQYSLQLNLPEATAPSARLDQGMTAQGAGTLQISILDNDTNPNGAPATLTPSLQTLGIGSFAINTDKSLSYSPIAGYYGIDRATYKVTDDLGLSSNTVDINVQVLDFALATPWNNTRRPLDVNDDGKISAVDALLVINAINARSSKALPTSLASATGIFGFVDSSNDNSLAPIDALLVINELNRISSGGEGESPAHHDIALQQMVMQDAPEVQKRKRR